MTPLEAILLGMVQGLTEPLPVSSSAHLVIVPALLPGFHQPSVLFDVILHLGTLFAVIFFLRSEITELIFSLAPETWSAGTRRFAGGKERCDNRRMVLLIVVSTFLTGLIGLLFRDRIESLFNSVETTASMLLVTGILLFLSDRVKKTERLKGDMTLKDGIILGLVQAVALIPGISRSGSTITFGIFLGLERKTAARYSFLLSVPAIAGAVVLKSAEMAKIPAGDLAALGVGFLSAAVTGFFSLKLLFAMLSQTGLGIFAYYCWFAGLATLIFRGLQP